MPDEAQTEKTEQEELQEVLEQRVSDFKHSFETPSGKRTYDYLAKFCFKNQSTFNASSQSTCNFNEGSRFVILEIDKWKEMDLMKGTKL